MNWNVIKNFLICLFAAINVFLLSIIILDHKNTVDNEKQLVELTLNYLETNNITLSKEKMPKSTETMDSLIIKNCVDGEKEFAARLLGHDPLNEDGIYAWEQKKVWFAGNDFYYQDNSISEGAPENPSALAREFLKKAGLDLQHALFEEDKNTVIVSQKYSNYKIYDSLIMIKIGMTGVRELHGAFNEITLNNKGTEIRNISGAHFEFANEMDTEGPVVIESIEIGYSMNFGAGDFNYKEAETVPAYRILANGEYYLYDARAKKGNSQ